MSKILITGNGFDLNIGLPTSYGDFMRILTYVKENEDFHFDKVYANSSHFSVIQSNFDNFDLDLIKIEELKKQLAHNWWFDFFKDEYDLETWIDFENKIEYVLSLFSSAIDYLRNNIFLIASLNVSPSFTYNLDLFNQNIEIIKVLQKFGMIEFNGRHVILQNKYLVKKYNRFIDVDVDKITKDLYQQLINFKLIFNYYFEYLVFPFYAELKLKINSTFFKNINKHYTFNYTPTFEKLYGNMGITHFLHGKINSLDNEIVLGVSEMPKHETIDRKYFIPFTKYFQKLNNNTDYVFIKEFEDYLSENYTFFFWGHSLDKSDEDYINEVFDFIESLKSKTNKIVIIYHNNIAKAKLLVNILNIRGKKNIQDLMRSGILIFATIDSTEVQTELNRDISKHYYF